ncbi:SMP-30/gluconolactonase/LRE family protein [uncultured Cohaesibacter sp.]|uniref:SMP-30/gluconolactonase/LRE family protein n=1 Tax=uncultured Cohaesibacter sp. TaxID=1002546 RepID=UPI00292FA48B|nr:SMP-30/gluconolactonase/LRE family protein [uncultured Cohaesibacter sp.]
MNHGLDKAIASPECGPIRPVTDVVCELGESPVWDERRAELFWCDIPAGKIWRHAPSTGQTSCMQFDDTIGCLGLCESGRLIVACGMDVLIVDPDGGDITPVHKLEKPDFPCRLNDGRVGPDGAFWVGTLHEVGFEDMKPIAALWRFTADRAEQVVGGIKCSNGLAFSADGKMMLRSDSVGLWVRKHAFDDSTGTIDEGRIICRPGEADGRPDGASMDMDGTYWSAGVSAGVLNGYKLDGSLNQRLELPVPHPTMPCFGGEDFKTLYLSSHRRSMSEAELVKSPLSGRLLSIEMQRPGFASPRFKDGDIL